MIRGTTQSFSYEMPYPKSQIAVAEISFWQNGNNNANITKALTDCTGDNASYVISVTLNQTETLAFNATTKAYTQFRGLTTDGQAFASLQAPITVYDVHTSTILEAGG